MLTEVDSVQNNACKFICHTSKGSKNNPKWLYLMNSQHIKENIHIEEIKSYFKKHCKRCLYSFYLLGIECINLVKSKSYWFCREKLSILGFRN